MSMLRYECYNGQKDAITYILTHSRKGDYIADISAEEYISRAKEMWVVYENDEPTAFFGVFNFILKGHSMILFVCTDRGTRYKKEFVDRGRKVIDKWIEDYGRLWFGVLWTFEMGVRMAKAFRFRLLANTGDYGIFVREW